MSITEIPGIVLSDCPFCGEEAGMFRYDNITLGCKQYYAECMNEECDVRPSTLLKDSYEEAMDAWNVRPVPHRPTNMEGAEFPDLEKTEEPFCLPEWWERPGDLFDSCEVNKLMSLNKEIDECDVLSPEGLDKFLLLLREKKFLTE